jgi:hypothetical protein
MREVFPVSKRWRGVFAALSLLCMLAALSISALAQENRLKVNIPFDFNVGKAAMPAGEYIVGNALSLGALSIRNADGQHSVDTPADYAVGKVYLERAELVFNRYGDQYFLSLVWSEGMSGRKLVESGLEREVKAARELATGGPSDWQKVVVLPHQ